MRTLSRHSVAQRKNSVYVYTENIRSLVNPKLLRPPYICTEWQYLYFFFRTGFFLYSVKPFSCTDIHRIRCLRCRHFGKKHFTCWPSLHKAHPFSIRARMPLCTECIMRTAIPKKILIPRILSKMFGDWWWKPNVFITISFIIKLSLKLLSKEIIRPSLWWIKFQTAGQSAFFSVCRISFSIYSSRHIGGCFCFYRSIF